MYILLAGCVGAGIDYYADDGWLVRVPEGLLDISRSRLEQLRHQALQTLTDDASRVPPIAIRRYHSDPVLAKATTSPIFHAHTLFRTLSDPLDIEDSRFRKELFLFAGILYTDTARITDYKSRQHKHGGIVKTESSISRVSRDSKQSDSGFESEQIQRHLPAALKDDISRWKEKECPITDVEDNADDEPERVGWFDSSWRQQQMRKVDRKRRLRAKRLGQWREKGAELLSMGRKWAKHMLDRRHHSDDESFCSSTAGDSDIELHPVPEGMPGRAHRITRPTHEQPLEMDQLDLNRSYIDPKLIVSIPEQSSHVTAFNEDYHKRGLYVTQAFVHHARSNSDAPSLVSRDEDSRDGADQTNSFNNSDTCDDPLISGTPSPSRHKQQITYRPKQSSKHRHSPDVENRSTGIVNHAYHHDDGDDHQVETHSG